jgi:hypothetical protein
MEFLRAAIDLDGNNTAARDFLDDLNTIAIDEQVRPAGSKVNKAKPVKEKTNKVTGKATKQGKKIQEKDQFMAYFLIEMTEE